MLYSKLDLMPFIQLHIRADPKPQHGAVFLEQSIQSDGKVKNYCDSARKMLLS